MADAPTPEPTKPDLSEPFAGHFRPGSRFIQDWPGDRTFDGKPFGMGQCFSCGLLSKRSISPSLSVAAEATVDDRHLGHFFFLSDGTPSVPWCLVHAADLPGEAQRHLDFMVEQTKTASNPIEPEDIFESRRQSLTTGPYITHRDMAANFVIGANRKCPEWFPYREFQSPVEHRQERDMLRLEEERKAHQTRLAEMEAEIHRNSLKIAEALQAATEATGRFTTKWTYIAAGIAVLALLAFLAQYLFPDVGPTLGRLVTHASPRP
jgi:hypothetical protein